MNQNYDSVPWGLSGRYYLSHGYGDEKTFLTWTTSCNTAVASRQAGTACITERRLDLKGCGVSADALSPQQAIPLPI